MYLFFFFFFQAEDGIRDVAVTGVQTCALPICICAEARGGAELSGDGRRDGRAHPDAQDARASRARSTVACIGGPRMNPIDPRIHQALDGEIARDSLPAELRRAVERLDAAADVLAAAGPAAGLESRVMAGIRRPLPSRARPLVRWVSTAPTVMVR